MSEECGIYITGEGNGWQQTVTLLRKDGHPEIVLALVREAEKLAHAYPLPLPAGWPGVAANCLCCVDPYVTEPCAMEDLSDCLPWRYHIYLVTAFDDPLHPGQVSVTWEIEVIGDNGETVHIPRMSVDDAIALNQQLRRRA